MKNPIGMPADKIVGETEAEYRARKAPAKYAFEANRFYGPNERYSNGSGLSSSGLTLAQALAHFSTYRGREGETYCLTVTAPDGAVLHHAGPSKADTHRSMMRAYRRRDASTPHSPQLAARISYAHTSDTFSALIQDNADVVLFIGNTRITITPKAGDVQAEHAGVIARALNLSVATITVETMKS